MSEQPGSSNIYDLGYRHYEGARIGRRGTLSTLYVHGVRSAFGLGRRTSSKIFPFTLAVLAFIPAIIQLGIGAITTTLEQDVELFAYEDYFSYVRIILILFCATVAPELVGRDQRSRTLSLYFSRAVTRLDYTLAKLAALTSAMLVLTLGPLLVLFVGNGMADDDLSGYLADEWDLILPIVGGSLTISLTIAAVGMAVAAHLPRRAYSTAAIVATFILTFIAAHVLVDTVDVGVARWALLASPVAWEGTILWFFGVEPMDALRDANFDGWVYFVAQLVTIGVAVALTLRRYGRVSL